VISHRESFTALLELLDSQLDQIREGLGKVGPVIT
jgi:hypothetical protein